jgi:hypothetical protein
VLSAAMVFGSLPWLWSGKRRAVGLPPATSAEAPGGRPV